MFRRAAINLAGPEFNSVLGLKKLVIFDLSDATTKPQLERVSVARAISL